MTAEGIRIRVLGPIAIDAGDGAEPLRGQQATVLAILTAAAPNPVSFASFVDELWSGDPPQSARTGLAVVAHRLRKRLGDPASVVNAADGYQLTVPLTEIDSWAFDDLARMAKQRMAADPVAAVALLDDALDLWRGHPFQPLDLSERLRTLTMALDLRRLDAEELLAEGLLDAGRPQDAASLSTRLIADSPYREHRHELLALALYRCRRQAEALRAIDAARSLLLEDLGLDVGPALAKLEQDLLTQEPHLDTVPLHGGDTPALDANDDPTDGGGFVELQPTTTPLPRAPDIPFVGRETAETTLSDVVEAARLVTVTGAGGVGKSRLALRHAESSDSRRVVWLDLGDDDLDDLRPRLAGVLSARLDDEFGGIVDDLDGVPTLLVVDNADRVRAAAGQLARELLDATHSLQILVTARAPLNCLGERVVPLDPLDTDDAVSLLKNLAPAVTDDTGLRELASQLDCLPLSLVLVAPLLARRAPAQIHADLDRLLPEATHPGASDRRHTSLAMAFEWSLAMLADEHRELFASLSVFAGPFSADDAAAVTGTGTGDVDDALLALERARLIEADRGSAPPRHRMLNSARLAARAMLEPTQATELATRHAEHVAGIVERLASALEGPDEGTAVRRLETVDAELEPAFATLLNVDLDRATALALTMWEHDFLRQRFDRYRWLQQVVDVRPQHGGSSMAVATAALAAWADNRFDAALALADQAESVATRNAEPLPIAAVKARFNVAVHRGENQQAVGQLMLMYEESRRSWTARHHSDTLVIMAMGQAQFGQSQQALESAERALALVQQSGNPTSIAWARYAIGAAQLATDDRTAARTFNGAARLARSVSCTFVEAMALTGLGTALRRLGRGHQAQDVLVSVAELWARVRATTQLHRCAAELALLLIDSERADAPTALLAALELAEHAHPLLADDQQRLNESIAVAELDVAHDYDDPNRALLSAIRSTFGSATPTARS